MDLLEVLKQSKNETHKKTTLLWDNIEKKHKKTTQLKNNGRRVGQEDYPTSAVYTADVR